MTNEELGLLERAARAEGTHEELFGATQAACTERAARGRQALEDYASRHREWGDRGLSDELLIDLLTDLMHASDSEFYYFDFSRCAEMAAEHFSKETADD